LERLEQRCVLDTGLLGWPSGATIYAEDFENGAGSEWSHTSTEQTPQGSRRFLGSFGNDDVRLTLPASQVPAGTKVLRVEFDLFVLRTWDGNHDQSGSGPDRWSLTLGNGVALLDTTFSNNHPNSGFAGQAYPEPFGTGQFPPGTGAREINTLGYTFGEQPFDAVYALSRAFTYTGGDVVLSFQGLLTTPGFDESWGLDNVRLTAFTSGYSAPKDFDLRNPNGVWSYGWTAASGGPLQRYPDLRTLSDGTQYLTDPAIASLGAPSVIYNPTANVALPGNFPLLPGQLGLHPGPARQRSVVRWTAPEASTVTVAALFTGRDLLPTTTDVHVVRNGEELWSRAVHRFRAGPYFESTLEVQAGDTLDFAVGDGGNGFISDSTGLDVVLVPHPVAPPPAPSTFEFSAAQYEVHEGQPLAVLQVKRTGAAGSSAQVQWTTVDGTALAPGLRTPRGLADYTSASGTLHFRPRQTTAELRIPIRDDSRIEGDEDFSVQLSDPSAGHTLGDRTTARVVLHDNDPTVSFREAAAQKSERSGRVMLEVQLLPASSRPVTVAYAAIGGTATAGEDFRLLLGTLTFSPGQTRQFIPLVLLDDKAYEGDETIQIGLSAPVGAFLGNVAQQRVTLVDDDPPPPIPDPGSTPASALAIDLMTLPRQSFTEAIGRSDVDLFRIQLRGGEYLALDVDPAGGGPRLSSSRLSILDADGTTLLVTVGASEEPEGGGMTGNPAYLFQADADGGTYYIALSTTLQAVGRGLGYTLHFHRLGVSENVPDPKLLNTPGPMYAWFDGVATVGITGPTGYGFTLEGPWQQQVTSSRRSVLRSQVLTLPAGTRFTLRSPQGVAVPLLAQGPITIATKTYRWGDRVGVVNTPAIRLPVALDIVPINDLLADAFGSRFATVGLLSGDWLISLGGSLLASGKGHHADPVDALLAGVPYLRQKGPIQASAQLGSFQLDYSLIATPIDWAFDPADPMLYFRVEEVGTLKEPGLALSRHGLLEYKPQDVPSPLVEAGTTEFFGHVLATATVLFRVGPLPLEVDAEAIINVDADRDGAPLGGLRSVDRVFETLGGDPSVVRDMLHDLQFGANGKLNVLIDVDDHPFRMELGRASLVLNGFAETIWLRGQQGGTNPLAGTPLEKLHTAGTIVLEGMVDWQGDFFLSTTTSYRLAGVQLTYQITIADEGISARVAGRAEWSVKFDYGPGQVQGKAIAELEAELALQIDDDGKLVASGSAIASGKLRWNSTTVFSGTIDARIRSRGFRFRFPRGVGDLDLDLF
jgi:hypothetical protein